MPETATSDVDGSGLSVSYYVSFLALLFVLSLCVTCYSSLVRLPGWQGLATARTTVAVKTRVLSEAMGEMGKMDAEVEILFSISDDRRRLLSHEMPISGAGVVGHVFAGFVHWHARVCLRVNCGEKRGRLGLRTRTNRARGC